MSQQFPTIKTPSGVLLGHYDPTATFKVVSPTNRFLGFFSADTILANIFLYDLKFNKKSNLRCAVLKDRLNALVPLSNKGKAFQEHCLNKEGQSATGPIWALRGADRREQPSC